MAFGSRKVHGLYTGGLGTGSTCRMRGNKDLLGLNTPCGMARRRKEWASNMGSVHD